MIDSTFWWSITVWTEKGLARQIDNQVGGKKKDFLGSPFILHYPLLRTYWRRTSGVGRSPHHLHSSSSSRVARRVVKKELLTFRHSLCRPYCFPYPCTDFISNPRRRYSSILVANAIFLLPFFLLCLSFWLFLYAVWSKLIYLSIYPSPPFLTSFRLFSHPCRIHLVFQHTSIYPIFSVTFLYFFIRSAQTKHYFHLQFQTFKNFEYFFNFSYQSIEEVIRACQCFIHVTLEVQF